MSARDEDRPQIAQALLESAARGATSAQIAEQVVSALAATLASLGPIIGKGGVVALYRRSLDLTRAGHPWLPAPALRTELDTEALAASLAQQTPPRAAAGGGDLLKQLDDVLAGLIGATLTERLLRPVWANFLEAQRKPGASP